MPTNLPSDKKATIYNSFKTPEIAFFNDTYRDIVRGNNDFKNNSYPGYILGNTSFLEGFKFVYLGSCVNYCYAPRFKSQEQSINYVECHDNGTVFDKIARSFPDADLETKLRILKMINSTVLFSFGIPFFHAGQEIGLSKKMEDAPVMALVLTKPDLINEYREAFQKSGFAEGRARLQYRIFPIRGWIQRRRSGRDAPPEEFS